MQLQLCGLAIVSRRACVAGNQATSTASVSPYSYLVQVSEEVGISFVHKRRAIDIAVTITHGDWPPFAARLAMGTGGCGSSTGPLNDGSPFFYCPLLDVCVCTGYEHKVDNKTCKICSTVC